jgi:hypothetical protein
MPADFATGTVIDQPIKPNNSKVLAALIRAMRKTPDKMFFSSKKPGVKTPGVNQN